MIEFVFGKEPFSKTQYVIEKMKKALKDSKPCVLIVPEQQALYWDTLAAQSFEPTDAFHIEAVSFRRLADSVFRTYGGSAKNYINEAKSTLLMWSAVNAVSSELQVFTDKAREDRYVPLMLRTVSELKLYGVRPEDISEAADRLSNDSGSLPARLRDLSLISAAYDALVHQEYDDPEEIPDALEAALAHNNYFEGKSVFIDSFYTLTPKEIKVVRRIFEGACDVTVTFAMAEGESGAPHMEYVSSYMKEMARCAARVGKDIKRTSVPDGRENVFSYLSRALWDFGADSYFGDASPVSIIKCTDRHDEAILAAARIRSLVKDGARYGDIACVAADFDSLRGITDVELERCGIPVYVSGKTPVTSQPALRLLLFAASVCAGGWRREDVIACARTGLCSLSPDEADALELYTDTWRIRGKKRYTGDPWAMNADGYSTDESDWARELLLLANRAKEKLIPPLEAFSESFPGSVRDVCRAAYKLLCDFSVYQRLCDEVETLEREGKRAEAQKKSRVWDAVMQVLDTLATTVPDATVDAVRFAALLRRTADTCNIGTIPDGIDRVVLGSVGSVRTDSVKHLIVLGARSGEFPRVPGENGFFSDRDRQSLSLVGIELSPDTQKKQWEEMFRFGEVVSSPTETLTVIVPSDSSGNHPSMGVLRLEKLLPGAQVLDYTCPEGERIIRTRGKADNEFFAAPLSAENDRTQGAARARLFDRDINLTQTRIECFNTCAFKYYCQHILRLSECKRAELRPSEVGNFVHSVLEHFVKETAREAAYPLSREAVIARTERLIREYSEKVVPRELSGGYVEHLFSRLSKSIELFTLALNREFGQSSFVPHSFELKVGFSEELPAVPIRLSNEKNLTVRGIVDRMDVLRKDGKVYIRVVDYKTGSKTFSLQKVMRGENIQLLLYLFALCNMPKSCSFARELLPGGEKAVPAGAVYFSAKPGDIASPDLLSEGAAEDYALGMISRTGIVLGDTEVIGAMDSTLSGEYAPAYLDGKGNLRGSFVENESDFGTIEDALTEILRGVGNRMISGEAGACPSGYGAASPCQYCAMKPLCRHNGHYISSKLKGGDDGERA